MLAQVVVLIIAILVVLAQWITDDALRVLKEAAGLSHDQRRARWTKALGLLFLFFAVAQFFVPRKWFEPPPPMVATYGPDSLWLGMDARLIEHIGGDREDLVEYGHALISNTAYYLGPQGTVARITNGMNCQNCHLEAGTKAWGNNYSAVWSLYPKFRERSGSNETVVKRVNDCVQRSLNGTALDSNSREMQAILAYIEWVGTGVAKGTKPKGSGLAELPFLDRPADPLHGAEIYLAKCATCHQHDGSGLKREDGSTYQYPPLWGEHSYNIGAGLYRLSRFAGYVKNNMPQGVTWEAPQLTDEEAWDVAAYVNSQQRPGYDLSKDWPNIAGKPVDHPFGPFADSIPEAQHKYGPFGPIAEAKKKSKKQ